MKQGVSFYTQPMSETTYRFLLNFHRFKTAPWHFHVKYFQLTFFLSLLLFVKLLAAFCLFDQQVVYYLAYMLRHALMFSSSVAEKWGKWRGARRREGESRGLHVVSASPSVTLSVLFRGHSALQLCVCTRICRSWTSPRCFASWHVCW